MTTLFNGALAEFLKESEYNETFVSNSGTFDKWVDNKTVWIFFANRISTSDFTITMASRYDGLINYANLAKVGSVEVAGDNNGTIQFTYGGQSAGIYSRAIKIY